MNTHGAVPFSNSYEGMTYEEVQREFTITTLMECWQSENEALGFSPDDPTHLRQMVELMVDGAKFDVVAAMMPGGKT